MKLLEKGTNRLQQAFEAVDRRKFVLFSDIDIAAVDEALPIGWPNHQSAKYSVLNVGMG